MFMKVLSIFLLFGLPVILFFGGCIVNPVTLEQEFNIVSEEKELNIGRQAHPEIVRQYGYYQNQELQRYINGIGQNLVRYCPRQDITYHFTLLDSSVENAFAVPGGYIYITRGLLARLNSEAELAGVLGHEIGHIVGRDSATLMSQSMLAQIATLAGVATSSTGQDVAMASSLLLSSIMMGYGREKEFLADDQGIIYMSEAGYDPMQLTAFQRNLSQTSQTPTGLQAYNITHPNIFDRIARSEAKAKVLTVMQDTMAQLNSDNPINMEKNAGRGLVLSEKYLSCIEGIAYGPRERMRHIKIYSARDGDTLGSIAQRTLGSEQKAKILAELNGLPINLKLIPGSKIKTIY
jgi:predicted Zn-dependent protease